jgi:hypothetical protein
MFGTIRKHQTWLWVVIIGVMIVGMVTWQNQLGKAGGQQRGGGQYGAIDNKPITDVEYRNAQYEVSLEYYIRTGEWPDSGAAARDNFNVEQQTYFRILLVRRLEQFHITVDSDSVAQGANNVLRNLGRGEPVPFATFVERILTPRKATAEDFQRLIEHDLARQQLMSVIGIGGSVVPPQEIEALYVRGHEELAADAVFFNASNYLSRVPEPSPQLLGQFYTNNQAEYREPDQMQVSYVLFNVTNYLAEAKQTLTNLDKLAEEELRSLGTNALSFGKTPDDEKANIREQLIRKQATILAGRKAIEFQNALAGKAEQRTPKVEDLASVAKEKGMEIKVTKPFDKEYGPADINLGMSFPVSSLFNLTPEDPLVPGPISGVDGVYIVAYNKLIPSRIPPLDEIRSRVVADCKFREAMQAARNDGAAFGQAVTNGLAQGKTFAAICAAAKVNPVTVPPFAAVTETLPEVENYVDLNTFKSVALETPTGKSAGFVPTREGGLVIYARQRLPVDQAKMKQDMPAFSEQVRRERESEAFTLWFNREATAALKDLPVFQKPQPGAGA